MTVLTEGRHPGEFLMTEANGQRSRENITIASGAGIIAPGTVLGRITASRQVPGQRCGRHGWQPDGRGHRALWL